MKIGKALKSLILTILSIVVMMIVYKVVRPLMYEMLLSYGNHSYYCDFAAYGTAVGASLYACSFVGKPRKWALIINGALLCILGVVIAISMIYFRNQVFAGIFYGLEVIFVAIIATMYLIDHEQ